MRLVIGVLAGELNELRQSTERTRAQLSESQQREKVLVRRLAAKEQETQDYVVSTRTATTGSNVLTCASAVVVATVKIMFAYSKTFSDS